ncbi:hypothetical protein AVEN_136882-1 [Araneus ventricosus]|uniref:Uncharacterized protein n=1 Tax=Araneus ventricosus TaxID=182803 RepID=A0A4Y2RWN9_ARAVE|nr:hypothetical protein AVEN_137865-1 [Araneus ventricosus]GBN80094.1 hypothetical protein AVEN_198706-1 [Araneus ventricosus]GBN80129.1 hypothetical protein AVEN_127072-1 [Araneus ventricosus]GBN80218.1 hypothetical protein AVEN_136882-1 [Araneus ventricosus]
MNMREVRNEEKINKDMPLLLFDLQNVIPTPHASLFFLRKLNIYNLTVYYTPNKQVYYASWNETLSGLAGNGIASAFHKILTILAEMSWENDVTESVKWSDSCVPQNRDSIISNSVLHFLKDNPQVKSVTMKCSLPGHS